MSFFCDAVFKDYLISQFLKIIDVRSLCSNFNYFSTRGISYLIILINHRFGGSLGIARHLAWFSTINIMSCARSMTHGLTAGRKVPNVARKQRCYTRYHDQSGKRECRDKNLFSSFVSLFANARDKRRQILSRR